MPLWLLNVGLGTKRLLSNKWVQYALLAVALIAILFFMAKSIHDTGYKSGSSSVQAKWDRQVAADKEALRKTAVKQSDASNKIGQSATETQTKIKYETKYIVTEVPRYVTVKADADCSVPVGFFRVLDKAAGVEAVPYAASVDNDAPSGIALSETTGQIADNFGICRSAIAQVKDLQKWIREMQEAEK